MSSRKYTDLELIRGVAGDTPDTENRYERQSYPSIPQRVAGDTPDTENRYERQSYPSIPQRIVGDIPAIQHSLSSAGNHLTLLPSSPRDSMIVNENSKKRKLENGDSIVPKRVKVDGGVDPPMTPMTPKTTLRHIMTTNDVGYQQRLLSSVTDRTAQLYITRLLQSTNQKTKQLVADILDWQD